MFPKQKNLKSKKIKRKREDNLVIPGRKKVALEAEETAWK